MAEPNLTQEEYADIEAEVAARHVRLRKLAYEHIQNSEDSGNTLSRDKFREYLTQLLESDLKDNKSDLSKELQQYVIKELNDIFDKQIMPAYDENLKIHPRIINNRMPSAVEPAFKNEANAKVNEINEQLIKIANAALQSSEETGETPSEEQFHAYMQERLDEMMQNVPDNMKDYVTAYSGNWVNNDALTMYAASLDRKDRPVTGHFPWEKKSGKPESGGGDTPGDTPSDTPSDNPSPSENSDSSSNNNAAAQSTSVDLSTTNHNINNKPPYPEEVLHRPSIYNSMGGELGFRNAFTVHNLNGRRYYSAIDASILFNGEVVDEIIQIQWTVQENTMPLFGYNSYVWDEIAKGSRIIQGAFAINFVVPDYLNMVLQKSITNGAFNNTGRNVEQNKHSPMYKDSFSIAINYGSKDDILGETPCIILENAVLQSCGQAMDTQGANLVEMYQFIARDKSYSR